MTLTFKEWLKNEVSSLETIEKCVSLLRNDWNMKFPPNKTIGKWSFLLRNDQKYFICREPVDQKYRAHRWRCVWSVNLNHLNFRSILLSFDNFYRIMIMIQKRHQKSGHMDKKKINDYTEIYHSRKQFLIYQTIVSIDVFLWCFCLLFQSLLFFVCHVYYRLILFSKQFLQCFSS